jgi:hypothetical protein
MPTTLENGRSLTATHEGMYFRFDGISHRLSHKAHKYECYKIHRVWSDGINIKKHGLPIFIRPSFVSAHKLNQAIEIFTRDEFEKLPE